MLTLRFLYANLDHLRLRLLLLCGAGLIDGALSFAIPAYLAWVSRGGIEVERIPRVTGALLALYCASHFLQWLFRRYAEALGPELALHLRRKYLRALLGLSLRRYQEQLSGYFYALISRVSDGLSAITVELVWGVSRTATHLVLFLAAIAAESSFLLAFNLVVLALFLAVSRILAGRMQPVVQAGAAIRATTIGHHSEVAANVPLFVRLGATGFADSLVAAHNERATTAFNRQQLFHANRWLALHTLFAIAVIVSIAILLQEIARGEAPLSILILFMGALGMVKSNAERFAESMRSYLELETTRAILDRYITPSNVVPTPRLMSGLERLSLRNLAFSHPESAVVIRAAELTVRKGERILMEGASGAGKTTLLHLLGGWLDAGKGVREVNGESVQGPLSCAALISQEGDLLNLTLRDNLTLGTSVSDSRLTELLGEIGLGDWLAGLPHGLHTVLAERGSTASQGQRQRLTLIRALLLDRELYLIDEPTSNLDAGTEKMVVDFISRHFSGKTLVIASHRSGFAALADRRWTFDAHTVVAD